MSSLTIKMTMDSDARKFFLDAPRRFKNISDAVVYGVAVQVIENAIGRGKVPKESSALQNSGFCEKPDSSGNGAAGFSTPYAAYIHEGVSRFSGMKLIYHGGGGMKFLEAQLDEDGPGMNKHAAEIAARKLDATRNSMITSGLELSSVVSTTEDAAREKAHGIWSAENKGRKISW